ncbi:MAG: glycosyltransferase family 4 protein [Bacteroidales bacterium]|nr:glycosyltransferase family 4 protein [Bacteroidales bacterium]
MRNRTVLIISYYWPSSGGGGVQRWLKFAKYLPQNNWNVHVLVPKNADYPSYDPSLEKDIPNSVTVHKCRIWEPYNLFRVFTNREKGSKVNAGQFFDVGKQSLKDKIALWIRGNFLIPDPRVFWKYFAYKKGKKLIPSINPDIIITTGPPHSVHLIGLAIKKRFNLPWIADFRDPWSQLDILEKCYSSRLAIGMQKRLESKVLRSADTVLTVSSTWGAELTELGSVRTEVITNGFDQEDFKNYESKRNEKFRIVHTGIITSLRNPEAFWETLNEICAENELFRDKLDLFFIGNLDPGVKNSVTQYRYLANKFNYSGYVTHDKVICEYETSELLLVLLNKSKNALGHIPGKIFEYLATNKPILALGPTQGDAAKIIGNHGATCDFDDKNAIKQYVLKVWENYIKKENYTFDSAMKYSRQNLTKELSGIMQDML